MKKIHSPRQAKVGYFHNSLIVYQTVSSRLQYNRYQWVLGPRLKTWCFCLPAKWNWEDWWTSAKGTSHLKELFDATEGSVCVYMYIYVCACGSQRLMSSLITVSSGLPHWAFTGVLGIWTWVFFSYSEGTLPTKQLSPLPLILRFLFVCFFSERVLTCTPGWPRPHYVAQADLKVTGCFLFQSRKCWSYEGEAAYLAEPENFCCILMSLRTTRSAFLN